MIGLLGVYGYIALNVAVIALAGRRKHGGTWREWWRS